MAGRVSSEATRGDCGLGFVLLGGYRDIGGRFGHSRRLLRSIVLLRLSIEAAPDHWRLVEVMTWVRSGHGFLTMMIIICHHQDVVVSLVLIGGRMEDDSLLGDLGVQGGHAGPLCHQRSRRGDQSSRSLGSQRVNEAVEAVRPARVL